MSEEKEDKSLVQSTAEVVKSGLESAKGGVQSVADGVENLGELSEETLKKFHRLIENVADAILPAFEEGDDSVEEPPKRDTPANTG